MYNDDCEFINIDREWGEELGIEGWRQMPRFCRHEDEELFKNPRPFISPLDVTIDELTKRKDLDCKGCPWYKQVNFDVSLAKVD